jgi:hypothetical protein
MPDWLPEMASVNPWTEATYEMLYEIFCRDIRDASLKYVGNDVWIYCDLEDGREKIFWHLTSRKQKAEKIPRRKRKFFTAGQEYPEPERLPDPRRCERLTWVKPLIEHPANPEVLAWDYEEGDETVKTYIWIRDYDFVVIMKKYPDRKRRLITSFYVDSEYKKNDFTRKYANRIK